MPDISPGIGPIKVALELYVSPPGLLMNAVMVHGRVDTVMVRGQVDAMMERGILPARFKREV